ncbi:MAG TPA: hypothetical protein VN888_17505, partial [Mycobacterium sp.]|nr:hypothetical protein [Mycobacterium sp.]
NKGDLVSEPGHDCILLGVIMQPLGIVIGHIPRQDDFAKRPILNQMAQGSARFAEMSALILDSKM